MSTKMQRVRFAAFFSISLRISHGKYIAWRKAIVKDKIKLSMEYFDSEA